MVVNMMRWRPWPPPAHRKYEVRLTVRSLEGCDLLRDSAEKGNNNNNNETRLSVEIKWKGQKLTLGSLRRSSLRNITREEVCGKGDNQNGVVYWDEEFHSLCTLSAYKHNVFHPWEIAFTLFNGLNVRRKNKVAVVGTASLNLADLASADEKKDFDLNIPLTLPGGSVEPSPVLCVSVNLVELRVAQESMDQAQRSIVPVSSPSEPGESTLAEKDELSAIKAGLRKVKIFTDYVSSRKTKKAFHEEDSSEGRFSSRSEGGECSYSLDSDSIDDYGEENSDDEKEDASMRKSFSYGKLAHAYAGGTFYSSLRVNGDDECWVYYSNGKSDMGCLQREDLSVTSSEPSVLQSSKRSILSWRKRKLSFRSRKAKGEPLLKKAYAEEGGDDIDFDRRQLSSDESSLGLYKTEDDSFSSRASVSEFGDDTFAIGSWEQKEIISRDGHMKLLTQVFFASIDQRNERAAGESACTALVAVIADWFQNNPDFMPIKCQFDSLIREGSLEWRNLCENETYRERFPDKHFDLDTVIQAKIRPLSVVHGKSFIGFFHPEGMEEGTFDFLHGAMSFDNIWDEISRAEQECLSKAEPRVYILSWNDHFFILKVEADAYYIIDTLGERLYEGCKQAYILKFDDSTVINKIKSVAQSSDEQAASDKQAARVSSERKGKPDQQVNDKEVASDVEPEGQVKDELEEELVCQGKEACKEYIKSFLAAIPIRELQADVKKGLISSIPLHHRLQIEFHFTQLLPSPSVTPALPPTFNAAPENLALSVTEVLA